MPLPPDDPLSPALRALETGRLADARRMARALASAETSEAPLRERARSLVHDLSVDPVTVAVMATSGLLLVALVVLYGSGA